jgi:hypothetical protein
MACYKTFKMRPLGLFKVFATFSSEHISALQCALHTLESSITLVSYVKSRRTKVYETNSVSMVKLDNFPVFSTKKTEEIFFCRKKSQNSQKSYLVFKLIFVPLKCHHID